MSLLCSTGYKKTDQDLYNELKNLPRESNAAILNVLEGNDWQPVTKNNRR